MSDSPYADWAPRYFNAGWRGAIPLPARKKTPPPAGWTGHKSLSYPSYADITAWGEDHPNGNIALRLPPGVLGLDVDAYDNKPGADTLAGLEAEHGPLPSTWVSTSRDDGTSGIRLYRVPEGVNWIGALPGIETIHAGHRYLVAGPSIHPEGRTYRWTAPGGATIELPPPPGELPYLPPLWIPVLARTYARVEGADLGTAAVNEWVAELRAGPACQAVSSILARETAKLAASDGGARHDTARDASRALAAFGGEGHAGTAGALAELGEAFVAAATDPARGSPRNLKDAQREYRDLLAGAVRLAAAAHPAPLDDCDCVTAEGLYDLASQTRPSEDADPPALSDQGGPDAYIHPRDGLLAVKTTRSVLAQGPVAVDYTRALYRYANGVWHRDGETEVRRRIIELLGNRYRISHANTITDILSSQEPMFGDQNQDTQYLNLPNGLLDWRTGTLRPHDPQVPSTIRIPIPWDPDASCPQIEKWIGEVFPGDAREFVEEIIGYCLYNDNPLHKAILLFGRGRNGKSTFLRLLTALLGSENISRVTPQSLDENRFRAAELRGKLANLVGDVDPRMFKATETFKQLTGGDTIEAERKYGHPFRFYCRAVMVAAFNALPRSADTSEGFFSRWIVVPLTGYFPAGVADPGCEDKMHTEAELRGLLVLAVRGLARVLGRGRFELPASVEGETAVFRRVADPVRAFLDDYVPSLITEWLPRTHIYKDYSEWCGQNGYSPLAAAGFYERIEAAGRDLLTHVITARKREGTRGYIFTGTGQAGQSDLGLSLSSTRTYGGKSVASAPPAPSTIGNGIVTDVAVDGESPKTVCERCSQPLLLDIPGRVVCERCRLEGSVS